MTTHLAEVKLQELRYEQRKDSGNIRSVSRLVCLWYTASWASSYGK